MRSACTRPRATAFVAIGWCDMGEAKKRASAQAVINRAVLLCISQASAHLGKLGMEPAAVGELIIIELPGLNVEQTQQFVSDPIAWADKMFHLAKGPEL